MEYLNIIHWVKRTRPVVANLTVINCESMTEPAKRLLSAMIKSMGYEKFDIYDTQESTNNLEQHLAQHSPQLLLAIGDTAAEYLSKTTNSIPTIKTYHPNHLIKHPEDKKKAYQDLKGT